jgi:uncharacterized membrane protein (UPF0127 family)
MNITINDNLYNVKCVITQKDIQNGMMGKKFDGSFDGMLFLMDNGSHNFWMKDCFEHLDIIFIQDGIINKIHHNCPPCDKSECKHYEGSGDMVLELPGNQCKKYQIKEGDVVTIV